MNSKNSNSIKNSENIKTPLELKKINRRNIFMYLGAGALGLYALKNLPFRLFQQKIKAETSIKIKPSPYSVKRELTGNRKTDAGTKGKLNG